MNNAEVLFFVKVILPAVRWFKFFSKSMVGIGTTLAALDPNQRAIVLRGA